MDSIFDWPGKSDDEGNEHPAVPYMLDVAACAARPVPGRRLKPDDEAARMGWVKRCLSASMAILLAVPLARAEPLALGRFSAGITEGWQTRAFEGETSYRIMELDGRLVLEGDSVSSASSLYLEREIDLAARPVLEWSWRIAGTPAVADERSRGGDDFAARLYVVAPGRGLMGSPIAISYVWAGQAAAGDSWPNPFTSRVMMLALDSGNRDAGAWRTHRRNVQADFLRLFGREVDRLEGVAIMTDSDNSGLRARAWYGDIVLHPAECGELAVSGSGD